MAVLKQRVITAAVLGTVFIWGTLALPTAWFGCGLLLVMSLGAWEWGSLLGLSSPGARLCYSALALGLAALAWPLLDNQPFIGVLLMLACTYWCLVLVWLWRYTVTPRIPTLPLVGAAAGLITLIAPWAALIYLHGATPSGPYYVLFLMVLVWTADSGAFFAGHRWGRHKLAPRISPGKTWEGAGGALVVTLLLAYIGAPVLGLEEAQRPLFILICIVTVAFSIVGDLLESMFKRQHAVKDSGSLLPGHGGILDRVDSMTAAAPIFLLGLRGLFLK